MCGFLKIRKIQKIQCVYCSKGIGNLLISSFFIWKLSGNIVIFDIDKSRSL